MKNELKTMLAIYGFYKLIEPFAEVVIEGVQEATKWAKEDRQKNEASKWRKPYTSYASLYPENVEKVKTRADSCHISANATAKEKAQWLLNDILFDTREDAMAMLENIEEILSEYLVVTVFDVLDIMGTDCPYSYFDAAMNYGWKNDSSGLAYTPTGWKIERAVNYGSWQIKFPEVEPL